MKQLVKITKSQITEKGVQSLADRPNASAQYGVGGLSPQQLKLWFDKLVSFLAEKINELYDTISASDAADYIRLALDDYGVECLGDLVEAMLSGDFASSILQVLPSANSFATVPLQRYINDAAQAISENAEEIKKIREDCGSTIEAGLDKDTYALSIQLKNKTENSISKCSVDMSDLISYINEIRKSIYILQEAPPIATLSDAWLLCPPTLAQLATMD